MRSDGKARRIALLYLVVGLGCAAAAFGLISGRAAAAIASLAVLSALATYVLLVRAGRELVTAHSATMAAENRFSRTTEFAPVGIAVALGGKFLYLNPHALDLYGSRQSGKLCGEWVIDRVTAEDRDAVQMVMRQAETAPAGPVASSWFRLDGSTVQVECSAAPLEVDGSPGILLFLRAPAEPAADPAASILAESAHGLNNVLTVINGYAELLLHKLPQSDGSYTAVSEILAATRQGIDIAARMGAAANQTAPPASRKRAV